MTRKNISRNVFLVPKALFLGGILFVSVPIRSYASCYCCNGDPANPASIACVHDSTDGTTATCDSICGDFFCCGSLKCVDVGVNGKCSDLPEPLYSPPSCPTGCSSS